MHRHRLAKFVCLSALTALSACGKNEPAAPESPVVKVADAPSPPVASEPVPEAAPTPAPENVDAPEVKVADSTEPGAPAEEVPAEAKPEGEAVAAEPADKAVASKEEPPAEPKKTGKKKSGDKAADKTADAPAKVEKPKFTELGIEVTKPGSGMAATTGSRVIIHYKASVADAEKPFDSTFASNRPLEIELGGTAKLQVIEGLRRGLEGQTPGTELRLKIPASLGWGEKGNPAVGVPANADLVFEVQVLDVQ